MIDEVPHVGGIHLARWNRHPAGKIPYTDDMNSLNLHDFVHLGPLDIAACLNRHINNNASRLHLREHPTVNDARRRPAEKLGRGDHHIRQSAGLCHALLLHLQLFRCQLLCIAVLGLAGFSQIDLNEFRTQRLHLLGNNRPCIKGLDPSAETLGRRDRLQPGNTDPDDKDPGRFDGAGRGGHHWKDLVQLFRSKQNSHIPAEVGL